MDKKAGGFAAEVLTGSAPTGGRHIKYSDFEEMPILDAIKEKQDFDSLRLKRLLALPDLTRKENSPIKFIIDKILTLPGFKSFDVVQSPETITIKNGFDLFNFPSSHPSRKPSDTYFISTDRVLRTHTTSMWLYYLTDPKVRERLQSRGWLGELSYGKVYRKDEIDVKHFPVFHQIDGLYLARRKEKEITPKDLEAVLSNIVKAIFGPKIEYRFLEDEFPFTHPSIQIEIKWGDRWLEVVGAGIVHAKVLKNLDLDPEIYNGWAFGFGIERLAMIKNEIPDIRIFWSEDPRITRQFTSLDSKYKEVSKYPPVIRDISFVIEKNTSLNRFYEIVRYTGGDLVQEVKLTDEFEDAKKFGEDKKSYTFRIIYCSHERTLTNEEVNQIHEKVEEMVSKELGGTVR